MKVLIFNRQSDLSFSEPAVAQIAEAVVDLERHHYDEVSINFVTEKEISDLHAEFFQDPSPTDCISFPMDSDEEAGYRILGEIFVCPRTAIQYAKEHQLDPYEELTLYIIHGLLHLMGYDDVRKEDQQKMRAAEQRCISYLQEMHILLA